MSDLHIQGVSFIVSLNSPATARFLCNKAVMFGDTIKETSVVGYVSVGTGDGLDRKNGGCCHGLFQYNTPEFN